MPSLLVHAPAKLNLSLRIKDRRPDGFHDIESLFLALAFGDTLCLETAGSPLSLEIRMDWQTGEKIPELPPERNIISKAVSLFRSRTGYHTGLKITVTKRIPLGGGLGGGSSDAAATLLALNRLAPCLSDEALAVMGADLGSDVPFFLHCRASPAAWVTGRGESVQPVALPDAVFGLSFVLVNPGFPSDTARAFRQLDIYREKNPPQSLCASVPAPPDMSVPPADWQCTNDFLPVLDDGKAGPVYRDILSSLKDFGADFAGLSGSGSTCFGVFSDKGRVYSAKAYLLKRFPQVFETFPLAL